MALRREVVDLMRLHLLHKSRETIRISEVAIVQMQSLLGDMRILIEVVDASCVEGRTATDDAVHVIALRQEQLSEVAPVLTSNARDECAFH